MTDPFGGLFPEQNVLGKQHQRQQQQQPGHPAQQYFPGHVASVAPAAPGVTGWRPVGQQPAQPYTQPYAASNYSAGFSYGGGPLQQGVGGSSGAIGAQLSQVAPLAASPLATAVSAGRPPATNNSLSAGGVPAGQTLGLPWSSDGATRPSAPLTRGMYPPGVVGGGVGGTASGSGYLSQQQHFQGLNGAAWSTTPAQVGNANSPMSPPVARVQRSSSPPVVTTGDHDADGQGAEWAPPGEQINMYESMFASASAESVVPGAVSGQAAVQFFRRSRLPKETLRTIWSLCDPKLTGRIHRPGFFAAMRLIALAQASAPGLGTAAGAPIQAPSQSPSLSELEASRYAPLPAPRMDGFSSPVFSGASASPTISFTSAPASPTVIPSASATPGIMGGTAVGSVGGVPWSPLGGARVGSSAHPSVNPIVSMGPTVPTSSATPLGSATGSSIISTSSDLETIRISNFPKVEEDGDDDFGDFEAAEDVLPFSTADTIAVADVSADQVDNDDDDDNDDDGFGEFSGAPVEESSAQLETVASMASATTGPPAAGGESRVARLDPADAWTVGDGEGARADARGMGSIGSNGPMGDGLDDLIKRNLSAATTVPAHLADLQTTPSLLGMPHAPVMVDRASAIGSKLSVFDAMADLDLAAEQEEWNDFADESTAPPPPPTPPPSSPPPPAVPLTPAELPMPIATPLDVATGSEALRSDHAEIDVVGGGEGGRHEPISQLFQRPPFTGSSPTLPELRSNTAEDSSSAHPPAEMVYPVDAMIPKAAVRAVPSHSPDDVDHDDEWGDFEEAGVEEVDSGSITEGPVVVGTTNKTAAEKDKSVQSRNEEARGNGVGMTARNGSSLKQSPESSQVASAAVDGVLDGASIDGGHNGEAEDFDPFAEIASPTPSPHTLTSPTGLAGPQQTEGEGPELVLREEQIDPDSAAKKRATAVEDAADGGSSGVPLSLLELRNGLAARGRLEEASEAQQRMELPVVNMSRRVIQQHVNGNGSGTNLAEKGSGVESDEERDERDLERWRAAMILPPVQTLEELAATSFVGNSDGARRFRERFITGQPSLKDEAISIGGRKLDVALRRQRAARRAVLLSPVMRKTENEEVPVACADGDSDFELDLGMGVGAAGKLSPTLGDWARMVSYVKRSAEAGLIALSTPDNGSPSEGESNDDNGHGGTSSSGAKTAAESISPSSPSRSVLGGGLRGEVARSAQFAVFARGLREGVRVCRMLQAAAEDALETVVGFDSMEKKWNEFRRCAHKAASEGISDEIALLGGPRSDGRVGGGRPLSGLGEDRIALFSEEWAGVVPTVEAVRDVSLKAPVGSTLCAVSLQPLDMFCASPYALDDVEYCGIRYLAGAVNLWVNVSDKAPPRAVLSVSGN